MGLAKRMRNCRRSAFISAFDCSKLTSNFFACIDCCYLYPHQMYPFFLGSNQGFKVPFCLIVSFTANVAVIGHRAIKQECL
jgi:hypothetical protein